MKSKQNQIKTMTPGTAKAFLYHPLTIAYSLPTEQHMMDNVIADMQRGNIDIVLVPVQGGVEIWRRAPLSK